MAVEEKEFSKEELMNMEYNDPFEIEESGKYEEDDCCYICGNEFEKLTIGFNEKEQLFRFECSNCDSVYVGFKGEREKFILKGEERNWPEYLSEVLDFPFEAEVIDTHDDRAIFDWENFDGPKSMDDVKVLEVFYSMKYGVEAVVRKGRKKYPHVLEFLEIYDDESPNYVELENYKRWRMKYWRSDYLSALIEAFGK